jgi:hypothetical protein
MPYSPSDLNTEIITVIAQRSAAGDIVSRAWVVTAILAEHPLKRHSKKDPDDFSICCRRLAVSAAVDTALSRLKYQDEGGDPDTAELDLPKLPGYQHLRRVYPIRREGVIVLVPLAQMSDAEVTAKIKTYRKASVGFAEHAVELEHYLASRKLPGAA